MNIKDYQTIILGGIIGASIVLATTIAGISAIDFQKSQNQKITVTGSASQNVKSDIATFHFSYGTKAPTLKSGYQMMAKNKEIIKDFLTKSGIEEKDIVFNTISSYETYKKVGSYTTNDIQYYNLSANVEATSKNIETIKKISDNINSLINQDILIEYSNIRYMVSNLDELKIKMIGEATKNAKERASSMVQSAGNKIGTLNSAKMGVF
ncbi:SIMPL domain-containing protein, partial [bacterium]|nr:SIMPL domain-containing protein [bacterium]